MKSYNYPTLETQRLKTDYLTPADYNLWEAFLGDEETVQYFLPRGDMSLADFSKFWIDIQIQRYKDKR